MFKEDQATIKAKRLMERYPKIVFGKERELVALMHEHGIKLVCAAVRRCNDGDFTGVRNPIAVTFTTRLPALIAEEIIKQQDASRAQAQEKIQAASIERQTQEFNERMNTYPRVNECSIEDMMSTP